MKFNRMPIEIESPEEMGYDAIECNLAESSVRDRRLGDFDLKIEDLLLAYGEHMGRRDLRERIVADSPGLAPDDVLSTTGAAMALFLVATTLLDSGGHLVVIRPNYGTNLETPRTLGCAMTVLDLDFESGFALDPARLRAAMRPDTRLISLTHPHNPTGVLLAPEAIAAAVELAEKHHCHLLLDETYRDLNFKTPASAWAAAASPRVVSVGSLSKAYGVPGIRTGWLICRDRDLMQRFLAAKEQIVIGHSVLDEAVALEVLRQKHEWLPAMHAALRHNFGIIKNWMSGHSMLEWVEPQAGAVCFPRLKNGLTLDFEHFRRALFSDFGTVVGFGHWFEQPERYFRIGFGYPTPGELTEGLRRLDLCLKLHCHM